MGMFKLHLLHPAAVHFPIALLTTGLALQVFSRRWGSCRQPAAWLLWLGTLSAWAALGLGLLAEDAAPHVPPAWETLAEHEELAWWTVGLFSGLSLWRWRKPDKAEKLFLLAWAAAAAVLLAAAYHGGELVFKFGMGVGQ